MRKYTALLFDADETLLDFKRSERSAFALTAAHWDVEDTEEVYQAYSSSNLEAWKLFELGKITKDRLTVYRFERFFEKRGLTFSAEEWNRFYKTQLGNTGFLLPGAIDILEYAVKHFSLYMVTNGLHDVQQNRIRLAGIGHYFKKIYTSEKLGSQKPQKEFFDKVFADSGLDCSSVLLIGDSLSSDITGGIRYGIDTCFLNWNDTETELHPTYVVHNLQELLGLLQKLG